jgi:hypothetical protein
MDKKTYLVPWQDDEFQQDASNATILSGKKHNVFPPCM